MTTISVSQLNTYIKALFEDSAPLKSIYIVGEISNFHHHYASGHLYFTLKDEKSQIKCIMFASNASKLKFDVEDSMKVICRGRVSVYERDGAYQLYCDDMQPDGIGALSIAFEQLKKKLESDGYFDLSHKKQIPKYPKKIGVATSITGAAVEDIKNITARRFPLSRIVIVPTVVQGTMAPKSIADAIETLDSIDDVDVIITGRGGGSVEDLWGFNSIEVAKAVYNCKTPIISAVGHETDYTICDFVADLRAPTPSAAAELAVPDFRNELINIETYYNAIMVSMFRKLDEENQRLDKLTISDYLLNPQNIYKARLDDLLAVKERLDDSYKYLLDEKQYGLSSLINQLDALSPLSVLKRGYSLVTKSEKIIKSKNDIINNDDITLNFSDGSITANISNIRR